MPEAYHLYIHSLWKCVAVPRLLRAVTIDPHAIALRTPDDERTLTWRMSAASGHERRAPCRRYSVGSGATTRSAGFADVAGFASRGGHCCDGRQHVPSCAETNRGT